MWRSCFFEVVWYCLFRHGRVISWRPSMPKTVKPLMDDACCSRKALLIATQLSTLSAVAETLRTNHATAMVPVVIHLLHSGSHRSECSGISFYSLKAQLQHWYETWSKSLRPHADDHTQGFTPEILYFTAKPDGHTREQIFTDILKNILWHGIPYGIKHNGTHPSSHCWYDPPPVPATSSVES